MGRVFDTLEEVDIAGDIFTKPLPLGPEGLVKTGVLDNGVTYYVRSGVTRPRGFAALSLVVRAGSLCETDEERGVAHLVEHLAFNATERFDHHEVVKFLESIGSEYGPCLNAFTSPDETIYHLRVPHHSTGAGGGGVDDPALVILDQGISILSEWAYRIRFLPEDIAKEKDVILEELRASETSAGRLQKSHWKLIFQDSPYADRIPIGSESEVKSCTAETVRRWYKKWYRPDLMAVVAVGDFDDVDAVAQLVRRHFMDMRSALSLSLGGGGGSFASRVRRSSLGHAPHRRRRSSSSNSNINISNMILSASALNNNSSSAVLVKGLGEGEGEESNSTTSAPDVPSSSSLDLDLDSVVLISAANAANANAHTNNNTTTTTVTSSFPSESTIITPRKKESFQMVESELSMLTSPSGEVVEVLSTPPPAAVMAVAVHNGGFSNAEDGVVNDDVIITRNTPPTLIPIPTPNRSERTGHKERRHSHSHHRSRRSSRCVSGSESATSDPFGTPLRGDGGGGDNGNGNGNGALDSRDVDPKSILAVSSSSSFALLMSSSPSSSSPALLLSPPDAPFVPHDQPLVSVVCEEEATFPGGSIFLSFKSAKKPIVSAQDYLEDLLLNAFQDAVQKRLSKLRYRKPTPPYATAEISSDDLCRTVRATAIIIQPYNIGIESGSMSSDKVTTHFSSSSTPSSTPSPSLPPLLVALKTVLTELARIRRFGFSAREVEGVHREMKRMAEAAWLEAEKILLDTARDELIQNFLSKEFSTGPEFEARLSKTLLKQFVTAEAIAACAKTLTSSHSCVVKVVVDRSDSVSESDVLAVIKAVDLAERGEGEGGENSILRWEEAYHQSHKSNGSNSNGCCLSEPSKPCSDSPSPSVDEMNQKTQNKLNPDDNLNSNSNPDEEDDNNNNNSNNSNNNNNSNNLTLMPQLPPSGFISAERYLPSLDAYEYRLSNGMTLCLRPSRWQKNEIHFAGSALGGLSQLPPALFHSARLSKLIAWELGMFGLPPEALDEALADTSVNVDVSEGAFSRTFRGSCTSDDLEVAFQLLHRLFTHKVSLKGFSGGEGGGGGVKGLRGEDISNDDQNSNSNNNKNKSNAPSLALLHNALRICNETVTSQKRNPLTRFHSLISLVNSSDCYYFAPLSAAAVAAVDVDLALAHHNMSYHNPAEFRIILTGDFDREEVDSLAKMYLASIPSSGLSPVLSPSSVTPLPVQFPPSPRAYEVVWRVGGGERDDSENDSENSNSSGNNSGNNNNNNNNNTTTTTNNNNNCCYIDVCFPLCMQREEARSLLRWNRWVSRLIEKRLLQKLRFDHGIVYSLTAGVFTNCDAPGNTGPPLGELSVSLTCAPSNRLKVIDLVLEELTALQGGRGDGEGEEEGEEEGEKEGEKEGEEGRIKAEKRKTSIIQHTQNLSSSSSSSSSSNDPITTDAIAQAREELISVSIRLPDLKKSIPARPPSQEEISSLVLIERLKFESAQSEATFWLGAIAQAYEACEAEGFGNVDDAYVDLISTRNEVISKLSGETFTSVIRKLLPNPPTSRFTTLMLVPPEPSLMVKIKDFFAASRFVGGGGVSKREVKGGQEEEKEEEEKGEGEGTELGEEGKGKEKKKDGEKNTNVTNGWAWPAVSMIAVATAAAAAAAGVIYMKHVHRHVATALAAVTEVVAVAAEREGGGGEVVVELGIKALAQD